MKKLICATAVCALAIGVVAVPSALGVKSPKLVTGTVSVGVSPVPVPDATTSVSVTGNIAASSNCRKYRTLHFSWVSNGVAGPGVGSAVTRPNGDFSAALPRPTDTSTTTSGVALRTTVDQVTRKVGSKKKGKKTKKGRRFECLSIIADVPVPLSAS